MISEFAMEVARARRISSRLKPSRAWKPMWRQDAAHPDGVVVYANGIYTATLRRYADGFPLGGGPWAQIGIYCEDGEARHDWRDFQCIKNDLVGAEWEALELYPAESRLVDPSNYFILWAAPRIAIGLSHGRQIKSPEDCIAPQRGWFGGQPRSEGRSL
jgi:hypothetical protein